MLKPLLIAWAFLTRLPVPTGNVQPDQFGAAAACFPLVGFGLGALGLGARWLLGPQLGPELSAWLVLALLALLNGGLHLDGLADWFDAVGGGRGERARMLEIMRDPRLGAHGASALVLLLAAKQSALSGMAPHALALALVGGTAVARTAAVWLLAVFPSARAEGLGASFASHVRLRHAILASAFGWGGCAAFGLPALVPVLAASAAALLMGAWARWRLGGINGDVCGAAIEVGELACWIAIRAAG